MKTTHPAINSKFPQILIALIALFTLLLIPLDTGSTEFAKVLSDSFHAPLFAAVAIGSLHFYRTSQKPSQSILNNYLTSFLITLLLGITGEIAQYFFTSTRYAEPKDVITDALGAIAGLSLFARQDSKLQLRVLHRNLLLGIGLTAVTAVLIPLMWSSTFYIKRWSQTPDLVMFESDSGFHFLHAGNSEIMIAAIPPSWSNDRDKTQAALYVIPGNQNRWAGITLEEPVRDWSQYNQLVLNVINPHDDLLEINLRIDDRQHNQEFDDRFNRALHITPQTRTTFRIPISEISSGPVMRKMDIHNITKLVLFTDVQHNSHSFYLCQMRLE